MAKRRSRQSLSLVGAIVVILFILYNVILGGGGNGNGTPTVPPVVAGADTQANTSVDTAVPATAGATYGSTWLKIYFTNPNPPDQVNQGIDQIVVAEVNQAQKTIDVTSFDLNLPSFVNAVAAAARRGVQVRVVYDGENGGQTLDANQSPTGKEFDAVSVMKDAGVQLVNDGRSNGLMHDKIIIIDSKTLFMGSWNMSYNDTFRNNNNLLEITDQTLVANYQAKFDELFIDKRFGTHAEIGAQTPEMMIDGTKVLNYFSPVDNVMDKLVGLVNGAQKSIRFIAFTYTDKDLAAAMIDRYKAGVDVAGVIENRGASQGALVPLACAKVPVKVDGNKYTMHHKVIVIDDSIVITGSFNFTKSADTANDDNVLVIYDPAVAKQYLAEYERVNRIAKDPDPADLTCS
ncbi:MAG TPA: phospholipase D-like domain-containing protein [Anaerolineales bacterium]|nr:phospholipase D-like domain-containing protein [Anaerolineales bacterium]